MKVLLTGATGYVGHRLALALAQHNITVHALVRDINSPNVPDHNNIIPFEGDICNYESITKAMTYCDYVFHTAAYTNLKCKHINGFYKTNVVGTENVLKAALEHQVKKMIYTSTLSVYGPSYKKVPIDENQPRIASYANDYELTKAMAEELVNKYRSKGLSSMVLNISKVYGPGLTTYSNGVNKLISMIAKKNVLIVPNRLKITSNYVYIEDVVNAHLLAMASDIKNGNYIIGGENISYKQLFNVIKRLTNSKMKILKINYNVTKTFFSFFNNLRALLGLPQTITPQVLDALFVNRLAVSNKAINELNYHPTSLRLGLEKTINYLKATR